MPALALQVLMEQVVITVHLLLALGLIAVVLMQRSEGGGLGIGGGGGGGANSGRPPATALGKVTWVLAIGFIATSITLTIIAADKSAGTSVLDRVGGGSSSASQPADPALPGAIDSLLPPSADENAPLVPSAD
jgi:preprotein translocase subunit SecG